jgi:hypothetical protein
MEGDVERAERDRLVEQLGDLGVQAAGEMNAAAVDADDRDGRTRIGIAFDDLVGHSSERTRDIVAVEHDLFPCIQLRFLPGLAGPG